MFRNGRIFIIQIRRRIFANEEKTKHIRIRTRRSIWFYKDKSSAKLAIKRTKASKSFNAWRIPKNHSFNEIKTTAKNLLGSCSISILSAVLLALFYTGFSPISLFIDHKDSISPFHFVSIIRFRLDYCVFIFKFSYLIHDFNNCFLI